jgi:sugar/nucleoside kinase (ribokinase family)
MNGEIYNVAKYDSVIIGHVSKDENIDHLGHTMLMPGGAVLYSSASAYALGHNVLVVTKIAPEDNYVMEFFSVPKENILRLDSKKSTNIKNVYHTADKERRTSTAFSQGDSFELKDIPTSVNAKIYHLAGLLYGDFPKDMIVGLSKRADVAVDVQALLRHRNPSDGSMFFEDYPYKREIFPYAKYLKTDIAEAEILTNLTDKHEAAKVLHGFGSKEVMITSSENVLIYDGKEFAVVPIRARNLSGRTGRGDTTFAAYINERLNSDVKTALLWATATVSLKMETPGPIKAKRSDIEKYIDENYKDYK